jgi:hypothetical protein
MELLEDYLESIQEIAPLMIAFSAASLSMGAFNIYKQHLTRAARSCKDLPPKEKAICMLRFKLQGKKAQLSSLNGNMPKCNKTKDAELCKQKLLNKARKVGSDIEFLAKRMDELRKQKS